MYMSRTLCQVSDQCGISLNKDQKENAVIASC